MTISPNTPVIVGVGFRQEPSTDPRECSEPYELMVQAVRAAAVDAGAEALLREIESISVPQGMWQYRNPGRLIGEAIGAPRARSVIADLGVLQLTLLTDLCRAIAAGEQTCGVVVGGEAQFRALRSMITRESVGDTEQPEDTPPPEVHLTSADPFCSDIEGRRGLHLPVELFAIMESSLRRHQGLSIDAHRDELGRLYSAFSEVAAANPHAWKRERVGTAAIREAAPKNPMLAFPYTKRHCSNWNVNQGVAILVCSVARAQQLGLDPLRWIFPLASAESKHVVVLAQQRRLHSHAGTRLCGERALALAGIRRQDLTAAELYSCFPAAIRSFAHDLQLEGVCPITVTGAMPFAGGPFNHFTLEGVARMVEVLRERAGFGLVSNLSGIFGKQGVMVLGTDAPEAGYRFEDVSEAAAEQEPPLPIDEEYVGPATVVGYTVIYSGERRSHAIAICDTPDGSRTVARTEDETLLEAMTAEEHCGRTVEIFADGSFTAA